MPAVGVPPRPAVAPVDAAVPAARRADLVRRVLGALSTIHRTLDAALAQAAPGALPGQTDALGVRPLRLDKVVAEAGLLMRCADHVDATDSSIADALRVLARRLAPLARCDAVLAHLCREPSGAIETAAAHVYLTDFGHRDNAFERFLREIVDAGATSGPERLPNHQLEHHWLGQIDAGQVDRMPVDAPLLARTCVASGLDVLGASTLDLYAFTHVLLYATDTGRRAVDWPRPLAGIEAEAEAALAVALDADNLDLAAELLWTWPMARLPWSAGAAFAFEVLAAAQDQHGFLPGPQFDAATLASLPVAERDAWLLRTSYHADVAMGILCAAALRPAQGAAPSGAADDPRAASIGDWLGLLPPSGRSPRWLDRQAALRATWGGALKPFVAAIVLRRAAAANDLDRLRAGLQAALDDGVDGPAVHQALALLRRATALGRLQQ
jgi:hypothetical protein